MRVPTAPFILTARFAVGIAAVGAAAVGFVAGCGTDQRGLGATGGATGSHDGGAGGTSGGTVGRGGATAMPGADAATDSCDGMPIPAIACAFGRTVPICALVVEGGDPPVYRWQITCPDQPPTVDAAVDIADASTGSADGRPGAADAAIGTADAGFADAETACGNTICGAGTTCCNASCGTCAAPGAGCTKQLCSAPVCEKDSDCEPVADYCTGCDCRALTKGTSAPACPGPGVRCLVDPCLNKVSTCVNRQCVLAVKS